MNFSLSKNPIVFFLLKVLALYFIWFCVYDLWLHPQETMDLFVIDKTIAFSKWILESLGYTVFTGVERVIGVDGTGGLWIGDNCNGVALFALFSGFVIAYKGKVKYKLFYLIIGVLSIQLLNVFRVVALGILDTHSRAWTEFNHTYTFTIVIYAYIFMLWMIWVNRFSEKT